MVTIPTVRAKVYTALTRGWEAQRMSWRDSASLEAQDDLDALVSTAIEFAQQQLLKHGEFYPFALTIDDTGAITALGARPSAYEDRPSSDSVLASSIAALIDRRGRIRASVLTTDVSLPDRTSAIRSDLEHRDGHAISVLLPYAKSRKGLKYGQLRGQKLDPKIWPNV